MEGGSNGRVSKMNQDDIVLSSDDIVLSSDDIVLSSDDIVLSSSSSSSFACLLLSTVKGRTHHVVVIVRLLDSS